MKSKIYKEFATSFYRDFKTYDDLSIQLMEVGARNIIVRNKIVGQFQGVEGLEFKVYFGVPLFGGRTYLKSKIITKNGDLANERAAKEIFLLLAQYIPKTS